MEKHTEFSVRSHTGSDASPHQAVHRPIIIRSEKCDWSASAVNGPVGAVRPIKDGPVIGPSKCEWVAAGVNRPVAADKCDWSSDSNVLSRSAAPTVNRPVIGPSKCEWVAVGVNQPGLSAAREINRPVIGPDKCDWVAQSYVPFRATPERTTPVVQPGA